MCAATRRRAVFRNGSAPSATEASFNKLDGPAGPCAGLRRGRYDIETEQPWSLTLDVHPGRRSSRAAGR